jgi:hypothetical protein
LAQSIFESHSLPEYDRIARQFRGTLGAGGALDFPALGPPDATTEAEALGSSTPASTGAGGASTTPLGAGGATAKNFLDIAHVAHTQNSTKNAIIVTVSHHGTGRREAFKVGSDRGASYFSEYVSAAARTSPSAPENTRLSARSAVRCSAF